MMANEWRPAEKKPCVLCLVQKIILEDYMTVYAIILSRKTIFQV